MSEQVPFAWVPERFVGERERGLARAVCTRASRELGLGEVAIRWLMPARKAGFSPSVETAFWTKDDGFWGMVRDSHPGTIFLRLGLSPPQIILTTAHECRHLWQADISPSWETWWRRQENPAHRADEEEDATAFAERFARGQGWRSTNWRG